MLRSLPTPTNPHKRAIVTFMANSEASQPTSPIIVALDFDNETQALDMADRLDPNLCRVKVGKELFTRCGPSIIKSLHAKSFQVFLDLKFHDIPHTVAKAVLAAADLGVWMVNVHASGGSNMMSAAREILDKNNHQETYLIAVTVLTSMSSGDLAELGIQVEPKEQVLKLAELAKKSGMDGVVCSAQESRMLKEALGWDFKLVTPGIRLDLNNNADDQQRIVTPSQAVKDGSDYLVMGRPITQAGDPIATLNQVVADLP